VPQKVESGVSDQPSTLEAWLEETTLGAGNRARAAAARGGTVLGMLSAWRAGCSTRATTKPSMCAPGCVIYDGVASHVGYRAGGLTLTHTSARLHAGHGTNTYPKSTVNPV
jgi:non-canonical (house-cleaning) NTP pyrophosphatase